MQSESFATAILSPKSALPPGLKGHVPRRFAVYRNNVTVSLIRAMEANFPALRRLLGETYFAGLAREFVLRHPPQSPLMFAYGAAFPEFLKEQTDLAPYPYLSDVAALECLMRQAYHAADARVLAAEELAAFPPTQLGGLCFKPHPALCLLTSNHTVVSITQSNLLESPTPVSDPGRVERAMVTRPHFDVMLNALSVSQHVFVRCLSSEITLDEAADTAFNCDAAFDLAATLALVLQAGSFMAIKHQNACT